MSKISGKMLYYSAKRALGYMWKVREGPAATYILNIYVPYVYVCRYTSYTVYSTVRSAIYVHIVKKDTQYFTLVVHVDSTQL